MINSEAEYNQMLSDNNEYQYNNQREMSNHTPGPWIVAEDQVGDDDGNVIADVTLYNEWNTTEGIVTKEMPWEANARLIAAAPEMYELMPKLIHLLGNWAYIIDQIGNYDTSESWDLADKWIDIRLKIEGNTKEK